MPDPHELEGKFACGRDDLDQVARLERIGDFHLVRRNQRTQTDLYFDTRSLALRSDSCSLRLRETSGSYKATFKGPRQTVAAAEHETHLVKRVEIEAPVVPAPDDRSPFTERTDLEPVGRARGMLGNGGRLEPIARLVTNRRTRRFERDNGEAVELSLDDVQAVDLRNGRETHILEIEVELISGSDATLVAAASALREAVPALRPSASSKLARALGQA